MVPLGRIARRLRGRVDRVGFAARYRLAALTHRFGVAIPRTTAAGRYWSYEPTNAHGDDPGLAALDALPDDAVILDVGGHTGEYAVPLAVGTRRRVISFEPNGRSADRLRRTVDRNGVRDRVEVRRTGIGDADDERPFYRSTYSKLSAFDRESAARWGGAVEGVTPSRSGGSTRSWETTFPRRTGSRSTSRARSSTPSRERLGRSKPTARWSSSSDTASGGAGRRGLVPRTRLRGDRAGGCGDLPAGGGKPRRETQTLSDREPTHQ